MLAMGSCLTVTSALDIPPRNHHDTEQGKNSFTSYLLIWPIYANPSIFFATWAVTFQDCMVLKAQLQFQGILSPVCGNRTSTSDMGTRVAADTPNEETNRFLSANGYCGHIVSTACLGEKMLHQHVDRSFDIWPYVVRNFLGGVLTDMNT